MGHSKLSVTRFWNENKEENEEVGFQGFRFPDEWELVFPAYLASELTVPEGQNGSNCFLPLQWSCFDLFGAGHNSMNHTLRRLLPSLPKT